MRAVKVIVIILGVVLVALLIGCGNNDKGEVQEAQIPPPPAIQDEGMAPEETPETDETPVVEEAAQYSGNDEESLLQQWQDLGEDETDIRLALSLREELGMMLVTEWHIAQISVGTEESFELEVESGDYRFQVIGGKGLEGIYLYIEDPNSQVEGEYIAYNEDTGRSPLIDYTFNQAQTVRLIFKPALFEVGKDTAWYAWFIMVPQD
jgi:hypothetical protein